MEIFDYTFFRNALFGLVLISIASSIIGTYVVTRRLLFVAGGVTHACFGGLGLGYYLGISPLAMAGVFAVGSALGVEWLSATRRVREDSAISVVWALGMAIGILFVFLTPGYVPELNSFLFGSILTITRSDLLVFASYLVVLLAFLAVFYRLVVTCAFDSDFARTLGMPVRIVNSVMIVFVAVCIVLTLKLIGIMMLMSLFSMPQMIAELFTSRLKPMVVLAIVASVVCTVAGVFVAYLLNVPASATIVILLILVYGVLRLAVHFGLCGKSRMQ